VLGVDRVHTGLVTKNSCHGTWENHIFGIEPYELNCLADFVELQELKTELKEISGLGRNCMMFDTVKYWAYNAIRVHRGVTFLARINQLLILLRAQQHQFQMFSIYLRE